MSGSAIPSRVVTPVPVRGGLPEWRSVLKAHYRRLSISSRRKRFLAAVREDALDTVAEKSNPDLLIGIEENDRTCAVLEIHRTAHGHAEIAISVEDAYQGRGYGTRLFEAGIKHARDMNVKTADLYYHSGNIGVARLVANAGGTYTRYGSDICAEIDLRTC